MPTPVKFCRRNFEKSLILRTQWTDRWVHGGAPGWAHVGELGRYRFRLTPSTSDAEARPRPPTCARLSRHAKNVTMLLLSPENGFESQANKG